MMTSIEPAAFLGPAVFNACPIVLKGVKNRFVVTVQGCDGRYRFSLLVEWLSPLDRNATDGTQRRSGYMAP